MPLGFDRYLAVRSAYDASFSPDGKRISFLSDVTGVPEVWAVGAEGGWPDQLTFFGDRVMGARYAPNRPELLVGHDIGGNEREQFFLLREGVSTLDQLTNDLETIHVYGGYSRDGSQIAYASNARSPFFFDIFVRDMATGDTRCVLQRDGSWYARGWRPDGGALIVERVNRSLDSDLFLLDLSTGEPRHLTPHQGFASYSSPRFSPDGSRIWCLSDQDSDFTALGTLDPASGGFRPLVAPKWDVEAMALSDDGGTLAYAVNEDAYSVLYLLDTASGQSRPVPGLPKGVITFPRWSHDGSTLAFTLTTPTQSPDVWLVNRDGSGVRQFTRSPQGGLSQADLYPPETVRFATFDGLQVPALFFTPKGSGPFPCVMYVHGGPEGQSRPAWNPIIQFFVHRGYAVFVPNVRGSTGYGKTYCHLDDQEKRMDSVADLKAGWEWLAGSGRVDPKRIAVMGGSYGGFMTLAAVTEYPELWAGGVDIFGVANFVTFFQRTGPWRRQHRASEYGDPDTQADLLRRISPIHKIDRIQAPMIVLHGKNDPRVPIEETEQIVDGLRARGQPVEYVRFEDEGHGFVKLGNRITAYTAIADFLDRHVAGRA